MTTMAEQWRPIPGYGGMYELSNLGEVRSWRANGGKHKPGERAAKPRILTPVLWRKKTGQWVLEISFWNEDKKKKDIPVNLRLLMRDIWMDGPQPGKVVEVIDGDPTNVSLYNLRYSTKAEVNKRKDTSIRKPVAKCNAKHEVVEFYRSAQEAGDKNFLTASGIRHRIRRQTVRDGYYFRFDT